MNFIRQQAALAGAAHTWFDDLRTSSIPRNILNLGFVQMSCSLQSWRYWKPSTVTRGSHFFLCQLLNNPHPPRHMGSASCTPLLFHPLTVGAGDPDQLSHYVAIANVMFCPNNTQKLALLQQQQQTTQSPAPARGLLSYFCAGLPQNKHVQKHLRGSNSPTMHVQMNCLTHKLPRKSFPVIN